MEGNAKKCVERYFDLANEKDLAVVQGLCTMSRRPSVQRGRIGNGGRIVKNMLSNCLETIILGTKTILWYVNKTGTSSHKMDKSL